jgi:predicted  nucleic acid-binding Zn-ribbon protein
MDIEKTIEFILEQQGEFAAHFGALREQQAEFAARQVTSAQQIEALGQAVRDLLQVATLQSARLDAHDRRFEAQEKGLEAQGKRLEAQERRSEAFEQRFDQFLERFDAFLRGRSGDGR